LASPSPSFSFHQGFKPHQLRSRGPFFFFRELFSPPSPHFHFFLLFPPLPFKRGHLFFSFFHGNFFPPSPWRGRVLLRWWKCFFWHFFYVLSTPVTVGRILMFSPTASGLSFYYRPLHCFSKLPSFPFWQPNGPPLAPFPYRRNLFIPKTDWSPPPLPNLFSIRPLNLSGAFTYFPPQGAHGFSLLFFFFRVFLSGPVFRNGTIPSLPSS